VGKFLDAALIVFFFAISLRIRGVPFDEDLQLFLGLSLFIITLIFYSLGTYEGWTQKLSLSAELGRLLSAWVPAVLVLFIIFHISKLPGLGVPMDLLFIGAMPIVLILVRSLVHRVMKRFYLNRLESTVIVGATQAGIEIAKLFKKNSSLGYAFHGFFEDRTGPRNQVQGDWALLGKTADVAAHVRAHSIAQVIIALPMRDEPRIIRLVEELADTTATVCFVPDLFSFDLMQAGIWNLDGIPVVVLRDTPFRGVNLLLKSAFDFLFALVALILISPLFLIIAFIVKLTSSGPILYAQRRYGLNGQEIWVYKFRSMHVSSAEDFDQAKKGDPRITRIGGFLRRSSLDELPQFFNVLQGRMSIVGPRPHESSQNEVYRKLVTGYMLRYKVKPGITGWAQVNGYRGETEILRKMQRRIKYDEYYLRNWSFGFDILIIARTLWVVVRGVNAY